jgi:hypothetical protein
MNAGESEGQAILAAIGGLVVDVTFMQYLAARLVVFAGPEDNEMLLLKNGEKVFKRAREATGKFTDPGVADETRSWLREAEKFQRRRHELAHSIVLHIHRAGLYHPQSGRTLSLTARQAGELAAEASEHAALGSYMSIFQWRQALGLISPDKAVEKSEDSGPLPSRQAGPG